MDAVTVGYFSRWYDLILSFLPNVLGAIIVLVIGWIVGRLLGKAVRVILDKFSSHHLLAGSGPVTTLEKGGVTIGYIGDIAVRCFVYLIAVVAAADILNLEYLRRLMTLVVQYIPHVVAFIILLVVGFILADYFIDFLQRFYAHAKIELITPILLLLRLFLYFVVIVLALSQLMLDLTIIYTFATPVAWGIGLGIGVAIAIIVGFGLKNRSEAIMDQVLAALMKK
jgi:hypothetical protein